jgi:hypothetical protein
VLPPITPYYVMKVGHIPLIRYARPGAPEVAEQVAKIATQVRGVLLERLGPVVWESSVSRPPSPWKSWKKPPSCGTWPVAVPRAGRARAAGLRDTFKARW